MAQPDGGFDLITDAWGENVHEFESVRLYLLRSWGRLSAAITLHGVTGHFFEWCWYGFLKQDVPCTSSPERFALLTPTVIKQQ